MRDWFKRPVVVREIDGRRFFLDKDGEPIPYEHIAAALNAADPSAPYPSGEGIRLPGADASPPRTPTTVPADPRATLDRLTDVVGPTAEEVAEDCRRAQRVLDERGDPHGLWLPCACGHDIDVLQAVVDNDAAGIDEDGKRRFFGAGALITFLKCPACGKKTVLSYEEVVGEVAATDPRGREVRMPVRASEVDDTPDDATMAELADQARTRVFAERYGADVDALTEAFDAGYSAAVAVTRAASPIARHAAGRAAGIRSMLAALGIEVRDDG